MMTIYSTRCAAAGQSLPKSQAAVEARMIPGMSSAAMESLGVQVLGPKKSASCSVCQHDLLRCARRGTCRHRLLRPQRNVDVVFTGLAAYGARLHGPLG